MPPSSIPPLPPSLHPFGSAKVFLRPIFAWCSSSTLIKRSRNPGLCYHQKRTSTNEQQGQKRKKRTKSLIHQVGSIMSASREKGPDVSSSSIDRTIRPHRVPSVRQLPSFSPGQSLFCQFVGLFSISSEKSSWAPHSNGGPVKMPSNFQVT